MTQPLDLPLPESAVPDLPGFVHRYADVNRARLHYVIGGAGPKVVLLHGFPYTWMLWRVLMPLLAGAGYTVIAPDLRGLGHSSKPEDGYDCLNVAEDVREIVRISGGGPVNLVGADIGAMVAYAYASRHAQEIRTLVFAESLIPGFGLEELMNPATGGYWHFGFHAQVDIASMLTEGKEAAYLVPWYSMMSAAPDAAEKTKVTFLPHYAAPGGMRTAFKHYETLVADGHANRAAFTGKLPMPVLVLSGERGIPHDQTRACVEQVAAIIEADIVPQAAHTFASDNPVWVSERLTRFFDQPR